MTAAMDFWADGTPLCGQRSVYTVGFDNTAYHQCTRTHGHDGYHLCGCGSTWSEK